MEMFVGKAFHIWQRKDRLKTSKRNSVCDLKNLMAKLIAKYKQRKMDLTAVQASWLLVNLKFFIIKFERETQRSYNVITVFSLRYKQITGALIPLQEQNNMNLLGLERCVSG